MIIIGQDRKRVLYVTPWNVLGGGASNSIYQLMLDMKNRHPDIEPVLLVLQPDGEMTRQCELNGIEYLTARGKLWRTKGSSLKKKLTMHIKNFIKTMLYRKKIRDFLRHEHFDLIHSNTGTPLTGYELSRELGIPHVWHLRDYGIDDYNTYYIFPDEYVRRVYSEASAIIAVSGSVRECYVNEMKLCPADKTRVIWNGIKIPDAYEKDYSHEGSVNFCITGKVQDGKNQLMAVRACSKLITMTDRFTLHIIGSFKDKDYEEEIKRVIDSAGLNEHVKLWGFRSDVDELLNDMDVGLMLSRREGFGRVTVEYMMHYMPVIGVNTGATPEIVLDGETGYICPLNDSDRLAELMHRFIKNPELMRTMGTKGRERAVREFSLERNTDEIYRLYQEILSR